MKRNQKAEEKNVRERIRMVGLEVDGSNVAGFFHPFRKPNQPDTKLIIVK